MQGRVQKRRVICQVLNVLCLLAITMLKGIIALLNKLKFSHRMQKILRKPIVLPLFKPSLNQD